MKKIYLTILLIFLTSSGIRAAKKEISVLFVHYSVGGQMVRAGCTMLDRLRQINATDPVVFGADTAVITFRDYNVNYDLTSALSDTVIQSCVPTTFPGFTYRLVQGWARLTLQGEGSSSSLLRECFDIPQSERDTMFFWRMFESHNVPAYSGATDSVVEKYDLILIKQAYYHWANMDATLANEYKANLRKIVDSITISNQGHNIGLLFGTPLYARTNSPPAGQTDSSHAKATYRLATWFRDSLMVHSNFDRTRNLWLFDSYTHMCDTLVNDRSRWGLATANWLPGDPGSHLSEPVGSTLGQDSLVAFIERAVGDILVQQSGLISRQEIDRMIYDFQNGLATEEDVLLLIEQYNSGGQ